MDTQIILAVLASGGLWTVIGKIVDNKFNKKNDTDKRLDGIEKSIKEMSEQRAEDSAVQARIHILRFDDELINGVHHQQEYFRQILQDIDTYNRYCDEHPHFQNGFTVNAVIHINNTYQKLLANREFAERESKYEDE